MAGWHKEEIFLHQKYLNTLFIVISGPSAGGKTTLVKTIESIYPSLCLLIKHTDRKPRTYEENTKDYFFLSTADFEEVINAASALVKVYRYEHAYALCISEVERCLKLSKIPIFILDPNAAIEFKKIYKNSILVFVGPSSIEEVRERIKIRDESIIEKQKRLDCLGEEYQLRDLFDINDYCTDGYSFIEMLKGKIAEKRGNSSYDFKRC